MPIARDDESEPTEQYDPYRLPINILLISSLILLVFLVAVVLLGFYSVFCILALASGTFIGLVVCSYWDLGFDFEDLKTDVIKCFTAAAAAVIPIYLLSLARFELIPIRTFAIVSVLLYWFAIKISWLKLTGPEIFLTAVCAVSTMGLGAFLLFQIIHLFGFG